MAWIILGLYSISILIGIYAIYEIYHLKKLEKEKKSILTPTPKTEYIFRMIKEGKIGCSVFHEDVSSTWNAKTALESYRASSMVENIRIIQKIENSRRI